MLLHVQVEYSNKNTLKSLNPCGLYLWCTEKLTVGLVQISFISQPLSHSDPLRIIEECLSADLTKYTSERSAAFIWGGYLFAS